MKSFVRVMQDIGLMIARIVTGAILMLHGWRRWQDGIPAQVDLLNQFNVPYPDVFAWGAVIFELVGGMLLVFGLATPLVGLVLLAEQVMIITYAKWRLGPYLTDNGYEFNASMGALGLLFLVLGSGRAGVDSLFRRSPDDVERNALVDSDPA